VERVVLNALAKKCGFCRRILRVPRIIDHRFQEKPIQMNANASPQ